MHDAPHTSRLVHHTRKCLFSRHDPPVVCRVATEEDPRPVCGRACEDVDVANDMTCVRISVSTFFFFRSRPTWCIYDVQTPVAEKIKRMRIRPNRRVQVRFGYEPRTFGRDGRRREDRVRILGVPIDE